MRLEQGVAAEASSGTNGGFFNRMGRWFKK
jgi:hypothetical protein